MSFAENLQTARRKCGLTQEGLAEMLGVSRQAVSKWEQGDGFPEAEKLMILSEKLGVSLDSLMGRAPLYDQPCGRREDPVKDLEKVVYTMRYNPKSMGMLNRDMLKRDLFMVLGVAVFVDIISLASRDEPGFDRTLVISLIVTAAAAIALVLYFMITHPRRLIPEALIEASEEIELILPDDVTNWVTRDYAPGLRKGNVYICRRGDEGFDTVLGALRELKGARTRIEPDYPRLNLTVRTANASETIETFFENVTYGGKIYRVRQKDLDQLFFSPSFARLFHVE